MTTLIPSNGYYANQVIVFQAENHHFGDLLMRSIQGESPSPPRVVGLLTGAAHLSSPHWGGRGRFREEAPGDIWQVMRQKMVTLRVHVHITPLGLNQKLFFSVATVGTEGQRQCVGQERRLTLRHLSRCFSGHPQRSSVR